MAKEGGRDRDAKGGFLMVDGSGEGWAATKAITIG
jgi:hypothetical protein